MRNHNLAVAGDAPAIYYPESDGKPMAETDVHRDLMIDLIEALIQMIDSDRESNQMHVIMTYKPVCDSNQFHFFMIPSGS